MMAAVVSEWEKGHARLIADGEKAMNDYLREYGTFEERRLAITKEYGEKIAKASTEGEKLTLSKEMKQAVSTLDADFIKKTDLWKRLVRDTEDLTVREARTLSSELRKMVLSIADEEVRDKLIETLDDIDRRVEESAGKMKNIFGDSKWGAIANLFAGNGNFESKFSAMASSFGKAGKESGAIAGNMDSAAKSAKGATNNFATTFAIVDAIVTGIHNAAQDLKNTADYFREYEELVNGHASNSRFQQNMEGFAKFDEKVFSGFEKLKSGNLVGAITDNVQAWHYFFQKDKILEAEFMRQKREEYAINKEINVLYRERYDWAQRIGEATLGYLRRQGDELIRQRAENEKDQADLMAKLYASEYKESERIVKRKFLGIDWLDKDTVEVKWAPLAGKTWEEIERLAESGKLSEEGMTYYRAVKAAREEGEALADRQEEFAESVREAFSGTTYDSVVNSIVEGFKAGKKSAKDFADTFNDLMSNALSSALQMMADEKMRQWYEDFAKMGEGGWTQEEIKAARESFMAAIDAIGVDAEMIKQIAEFSGDLSDNTLKGEYAKASQESIDLLAGQTGALRVAVERILAWMQARPDVNEALITQLTGSLPYVTDMIAQSLIEMRGIRELTAIIKDSNQKIAENTGKTNELLSENKEAVAAVEAAVLSSETAVVKEVAGVTAATGKTTEALSNIDRNGLKIKTGGL
jgi:hypothetical protein